MQCGVFVIVVMRRIDNDITGCSIHRVAVIVYYYLPTIGSRRACVVINYSFNDTKINFSALKF